MILYTMPFFIVVMFLYEKFAYARKWPDVKSWYLRSIIIILVQFVTVYAGFFLWDHLFTTRSWALLRDLNTAWQVTIGFAVISFVSYWQHRIKHRFDFLWKYFHQIHHSPRRVEILTSFYRSPLEILVNMILMSLIMYMVLGISTESGAFVVFAMGIADLFYHWNIKTPTWIGFIVQRPESHCIHHLTGVHAYNYGDIAIWDIVFGTFKNPQDFSGQCGFTENMEIQFTKLMTGQLTEQHRMNQY